MIRRMLCGVVCLTVGLGVLAAPVPASAQFAGAAVPRAPQPAQPVRQPNPPPQAEPPVRPDAMSQSVQSAREARDRFLDNGRTTSPFERNREPGVSSLTAQPGQDFFRATPQTYAATLQTYAATPQTYGATPQTYAPRDTPYRPPVTGPTLYSGYPYYPPRGYAAYFPSVVRPEWTAYPARTVAAYDRYWQPSYWQAAYYQPPRPGNVDVFVDGLYTTAPPTAWHGQASCASALAPIVSI